MFNRILNILKINKKKQSEVKPEIKKHRGIFSTDDNYLTYNNVNSEEIYQEALDSIMKKQPINQVNKNFAMDNQLNTKTNFSGGAVLPASLMLWYSSQTFIGWQMCAIIAQHWLVSKACLMPAKDATRNGYEITINDGTEIDTKVLDEIRKLDVEYRLNYNLVQFIQMGRIFGIRIAMFVVESDDPDYYKKPFNPDGVKAGSYKGISQVDPYWITPQFDSIDAGNPSAIHFYEPTWWTISGRNIHRSHLIIYKTDELADILKPIYIYGGIPIPQKIYERVYAAERTANEAPMLALTKRTSVLKVDNAQALADQPNFNQRIQQWTQNWDNYGIKTIGLDEEVNQLDTSLADLDAVIMTQYQIVAAAAGVPAVKLLGTSPKGFNTTGEFEEANYHEELESIQAHDLSPLIERHHLLLIRSEIAPKFGIEPFNTTIVWNPLDAMTEKEKSELNRFKAETGVMLMNSGAIDGQDERQRIVNDPDSGYTGLINNEPFEEILSNPIGGEHGEYTSSH